jgi:NitT/TauT family transport system permease protein
MLTQKTYDALLTDSIPASVVYALKPLENKEFGKQDEFTAQLKTTIDATTFAKYEYDIVKNAQITGVVSVSSMLYNTSYSVLLNILGYIEAILFSIIVGFIIALFPFFRGLLSRYIDAIRFVPLAAVTGLFIAWFGIELNMKVQFLAFGIFVFLLPVVVQRIYEVEEVYKQTAFTLGASSWQTIRYVYWPHVLSRLIDDIRVLTAISWTYIIVAETVNKESGIGALIFTARRHSRLDHVFALLLLIIIIGFIQDLIFVRLDKRLNPHKY